MMRLWPGARCLLASDLWPSWPKAPTRRPGLRRLRSMQSRPGGLQAVRRALAYLRRRRREAVGAAVGVLVPREGTALSLGVLQRRLTIAALRAIAAIVWLLAKLVRRVGPLCGQVQQLLGGLNTILQEDLSGIRVIRAFGREGYELERY